MNGFLHLSLSLFSTSLRTHLQSSSFKPALITVTHCVHSCAPASYSLASSYLSSSVFVHALYISLTHYQLQLSTGVKRESDSKNILGRKLCVCWCVRSCISIVMGLHSTKKTGYQNQLYGSTSWQLSVTYCMFSIMLILQAFSGLCSCAKARVILILYSGGNIRDVIGFCRVNEEIIAGVPHHRCGWKMMKLMIALLISLNHNQETILFSFGCLQTNWG